MSTTSGWLVAMELAMFCRSMVLPVRGGATISPRWPLPMGVMRSITRAEKFDFSVSRFRRCIGIEGGQVVEEDLVPGHSRGLRS